MPAADSLLGSIHLLHRATQLADALFMRHAPNDGLTPRQFAVLETVAANTGLNQMDIMAATGIDRSSTAELVRRLVKARYLYRREPVATRVPTRSD